MLNNNEQNSLQRKPERQKKLRLAPLLLLLGSVVIMGTLLMVVWQVYATNSQSSSAGRTATQKQGGSGGQDAPFWDSYPAIYWKTLRTQVAQGFHMSEQQMQSAVNATKDLEDGMHGMLGKPLSDLATAHGISQDQLHTIEVNAVQKAHAVLVSLGALTQERADKNIRAIITMEQDVLNAHILDAFRMCQGKKTALCQG